MKIFNDKMTRFFAKQHEVMKRNISPISVVKEVVNCIMDKSHI